MGAFVGSLVWTVSVGFVEGLKVGESVKAKGIVTICSGQELTGPIKGFTYRQEHASILPVVVGTLTRSPDLAQTIKLDPLVFPSPSMVPASSSSCETPMLASLVDEVLAVVETSRVPVRVNTQ